MEIEQTLERRAAVHHALGDPSRLAIVDALALGEASPSELQALLDLPSNLLAHHVRVLDRAGVVMRTRSEADRRRTYLTLVPGVLDALGAVARHDAARVVFVCTQNSARSQLAAALWNQAQGNAGAGLVPATSAGTHPAPAVHPGAVAAARRHRVPLEPVTPRHADDVLDVGDLVVTVCDAAHEERPGDAHWSVADPARSGEPAAFDRALTDLAERISRFAPAVHPPEARPS